MNFKHITFKIFKVNFRRYLLFFLCSSFAILVFFTFMTIITNKDFMDPFKNSGSSNIIAPGLVVVIFSAFFTVYAQGSFIKFRKKEFGTFMVLGMTARNIRWIILFENSLITIFSLITGLAAGTVFSRFFYFLITKITDINTIPFSISFMSYLYTIGFFILIYLFIIAGSFIASSRYEIVKLIKSSRNRDKNLLSNPVWIIPGIVLMVLAFIDMAENFNAEHSTVILRSMILCFIGLYLIISNMVWLLSKAINPFHKRLDDSILIIADLEYGFGRSRKVLFLITLLTSITIFFSSLAGVLTYDSMSYALNYNPYDIAYSDLFGQNNISDVELNDIISHSDTPIISFKKLQIIATKYSINTHNFYYLISDKNLNEQLGTDIKVEKGKFISLFQNVKDDGYVHNTNSLDSLDIPSNSNYYTYKLQGVIIDVLFNNVCNAPNNQYYILNDSDFNNVKLNGTIMNVGSVKLLNFKDWHKTDSVLKELNSKLEGYNREHLKGYKEDIIVLLSKPASKIGDYLARKHGGDYLLFLISFVGILFFISSAVILHFQLLTEYDSEKLKYKKLFKIGITSDEVFKIVSKELKILFFTPFIASVFIAAFYSFNILSTRLEKLVSIKYSIAIGLLYISFQLIFYLLYRVPYIKSLIKTFEQY